MTTTLVASRNAIRQRRRMSLPRPHTLTVAFPAAFTSLSVLTTVGVHAYAATLKDVSIVCVTNCAATQMVTSAKSAHGVRNPVIGNVQSGAVSAQGSTGVTITKPTDLADGDVMYALISRTTFANNAAWTCSGWTDIGPAAASAGTTVGNDRQMTMLRKVVATASGEPSSYTFVNTQTTTYNVVGIIINVHGANTAVTEDAAIPAYNMVTDDATPASRAVTSTTNGALVIQIHQLSLGATAVKTPGAPSGYTLIPGGNASEVTGGATNNQLVTAYKVLGDGGSAAGTNVWTHTADDATTESLIAVVAIAAAPAPVILTTVGAHPQSSVSHEVSLASLTTVGVFSATASTHDLNLVFLTTVGVYSAAGVSHEVSVASATTAGAHPAAGVSHEISLAALTTAGPYSAAGVSHEVSLASLTTVGVHSVSDTSHTLNLVFLTTVGVFSGADYTKNADVAASTTVGAHSNGDVVHETSVPVLTTIAASTNGDVAHDVSVPVLVTAGAYTQRLIVIVGIQNPTLIIMSRVALGSTL